MKEIDDLISFTYLVFLIGILLSVVIGLPIIAHNCMKTKPQQYARTTIVIDFDEVNDLVIVADAVGHEWHFVGIEDWQIGDIASLLMSDCGTAENMDDEIIKVRYGGRLEWLQDNLKK